MQVNDWGRETVPRASAGRVGLSNISLLSRSQNPGEKNVSGHDAVSVTGHNSLFLPLQGDHFVALGVPALCLTLEGAAASFRQCAVAVRADLLFQFGFLLQPAFPVAADQGADVLVGGVGLTATSPGDAQVAQLLALPF